MLENRLRWREMLPIVTRELKVASRRRATYRLRAVVAALGAIEVIAGVALAGPSPAFGQWLFRFTAIIMLAAASVAGLLLTADSISKEKREGTLGLLFLTRLVGADVVLGKLSVAILSGSSVAFAAAPFLALSVCLGGVTGRECIVMAGLLAVVLLYSIVFGIFVSTFFRREVVVSLLFLAGMYLPTALTPFAIIKWKEIPPVMAMLNPLFPVFSTFDVDEVWFATAHLRGVLVFQLFAVVAMLGIGCVAVPWTLRPRPVNTRPKTIGRIRKASRRALLDANPVLWLSQRRIRPFTLLWLFAGVGLVLGFSSKVQYESDIAYVALLAVLPKLIVLWHASGAMTDDRDSGFLEILLTTPIPGSRVLRGKMGAIKGQIFPALVFALLLQTVTVIHWWRLDHEISPSTTMLMIAMVISIVDVHTVAWIGMWQGLMARDRRRALVRAALWGFLAPMLPPVLLAFVIQVIFDPGWLTEPVFVLAPGIAATSVCSVGIACLAMARLHEKFRSTATETWSLRAAH